MSHDIRYAGPMSAHSERRWATLGHVIPLLAMIFSVGTLGFVASLVLFLVYGGNGPFVRQHLWNSLKIQIWTAIFLLISLALMIVAVGYVTYPIVLVIAAWRHIVWAMRANRGEWVHAR